jgi:hypothetical protein
MASGMPSSRRQISATTPAASGQAVEHEPRVAQRRQVDEHDPIREVIRYPPGHLDGQPGLAHAARAGEDKQPHVAAAQQPGHGLGHAGPADKRRQRPRDPRDAEGRPRSGLVGLGPRRGQQGGALTRTERAGQQPDRI